MSTTFVPPRPDQWEGPVTKAAGAFTPPPVNSWQGTSGAAVPGATEKPGLLSGAYNQVPGPIVEAIKHPLTAVWSAAGGPKLEAIAHDVKEGDFGQAAWKAIDGPNLEAIRTNLKAGKYADAGMLLAKHLLRSAPSGDAAAGMAEPIVHDVQEGNYASAIGRAAATGATFAVPELLGKLLPKAPGAKAPIKALLPETKAANEAAVLKAGMEETPWGSFDDVAQAAAAGDERAAQLLSKLEAAGSDPDKILQGSIGLTDFRTRLHAGKLYDQVEGLVEQHNLGDVPLNETGRTLQVARGAAESSKIPNSPVLNLLKKIQGNLESNNSYPVIRQLRADLGDEIRGYYSGGNKVIGEKGVQYLQQLKSAVERDLARFTEQSKVPDVQQAAKTADEFYKSARVPFRDAGLAKAVTTTEPDTIFQNFIKAGRGDRAEKFYDALDAKGKAAVQYRMFAKAVNDATDPVSGFDSAAFSKSMDKLPEAYKVFFKGPDKAAMDGVRNLMIHAGKVDKAPAQAILPESLGGKWGSFIPGSTKLANILMNSERGRQYLYRMSSATPGSPAMGAILESARKAIPLLNSPEFGGTSQPQQ